MTVCHLGKLLHLLKITVFAIEYCQGELFYFAVSILGEKTHLKLKYLYMAWDLLVRHLC